MDDYEKLGAFYLGKLFDLENRQLRPDLLLYDSKDLTTHAVCVGMTGSGKTGLCLTLLEEAAIDGIPAIAIDPKGDLGNLLLTFPDLKATDFQPWIDPGEAARAQKSVEEYAQETADRWRSGLAEWGQTPERIARFRDAADAAIYTPGSTSGLPISVVQSFAAPAPIVMEDPDAFRERIVSTVSGLLTLLGIDPDPIRSREHILLSNLVEKAWKAGRTLDMAGLIREIQSPPLDKVGFLDVETFFPEKQRFELALRLNNLLATPAFAAWLEGEPLNIGRLLHTPEGKPRLSIMSIAHLSDPERMFFVTLLLSEIISWMRAQPGTSSLRALIYMDEVFGYFPPTANPPSKTPLLTLMKQARAYGVGIVLATQNPVDLDYKGLSNAGTWLLGRLQTERDKERVLEGLEGASSAAGMNFDRQRMGATLAGLGKRVFLMNNVHEDEPTVFQTRWALSYLRGPLTRQQIQTLMQPRKAAAATKDETPKPAAPPTVAAPSSATNQRPVVAAGVTEIFIEPQRATPKGAQLTYLPAMLGEVKVHFVASKWNIDEWQTVRLLSMVSDEMPGEMWEQASEIGEELESTSEPDETYQFAPVPNDLTNAKKVAKWDTALRNVLYQNQRLTVWRCAELKEISHSNESEGDFRVRLSEAARERRDAELERLRVRFAPKVRRLDERMRTAKQRVDREKSQASQQTYSAAVSFGQSILGALFGRKIASATNVGKAATSVRAAGRAVREQSDVGRAEESVEAIEQEMADLDAEFEEQRQKIQASAEPQNLALETIEVRCRKSDLSVTKLALAWTPWAIAPGAAPQALFEMGTK